MADVFISYSTGKADNTVQQIADALDRAGISCWYMGRNSRYGTFAGQIAQEIFSCHVFILILDEKSNQSEHVQNEVGLAFRRFNEHQPITILPFQIDDCVLSYELLYYLNRFTITSANPPTEQRIRKLVEQITDILSEDISESEVELTPKINRNPIFWVALIVLLAFFIAYLYHSAQMFDGNDTIEESSLIWSINKNGILTIYETENGEMVPYDSLNPYPWEERREEIIRIIISEGIAKINEYAFSEYNHVESVIMPDSITTIGDFAFYHCGKLSDITIPNSVTFIGNYAFYGCAFTHITIPEGVTSISWSAFEACSNLMQVNLSDNVTTIEMRAFADCVNLEDIHIPNSLTSIKNEVFSGCATLKNIDIPQSVTQIGDSAFFGCTALNSVSIPDSVTFIGDSAFADCESLANVSVPSKAIIARNAFNKWHTEVIRRE